MNIIVPNENIYEYFKRHAYGYINNTAIEYFGTKISYKNFLYEIDRCARAYKRIGIKKGDVVSIISANIPEALISFYALNKIGAVSNMLHPLLSENEILDNLKKYSTVVVMAIDVTYSKLKNILKDTDVYKTVIMSAKDSMGFFMKVGYEITQGFKVEKPKSSDNYLFWKDFIRLGDGYVNN